MLLLSPYHFCPLSSPFCMKCSLDIPDFLEEISSLSHSVVFPYFFALIAEEGFLISHCYSLGLCIQMLISFLFSFAFASLLFIAICKASPDSHFAFLHFFSMGMVLIPVLEIKCINHLSKQVRLNLISSVFIWMKECVLTLAVVQLLSSV